jgi:DNA repair protein RAD5
MLARDLLSLSASSLGMMSDEEKKLQRIEDIKELLS